MNSPKPCGCRVEMGPYNEFDAAIGAVQTHEIIYCPLHAAAGEMWEALEQAVSDMAWAESKGANFQSSIIKARAALAQADNGNVATD